MIFLFLFLFGVFVVWSIISAMRKNQSRNKYLASIPVQTSEGRISETEVKSIVLEEFGYDLKISTNTDLDYKLVDIQTLKKFIEEHILPEPDNNSKWTYTDNSFLLWEKIRKWDSDLAFYLIQGLNPHGDKCAWNWCLDMDKNIWFIEPQNNKMFEVSEYWKITKVDI